jgi:photosystem II stability/assembly factor-like uncharacterized protein
MTASRLCALACLVAAALAQNPDPKLLESLEFRSIGPTTMGGRTADIESVPGKPHIVYAGTGGGGLWKSVNGGQKWTSIFDGYGTLSVGDLALDPRNPETIWLGTGEANMRNSVSFGTGVYKSPDGGKTWKHLGLSDTMHIARVLVHPLDSNTAYVCAIGHQSGPNDERGVFMTTDGGVTWNKTLFVDNQHGCSDLDIDPQNPNLLFAAVWRFERKAWNHTSGSEKGGLFKSSDGGRTWKKITDGLPKLMGRVGVKVAPSKPEVVYVVAESKEGVLFRSSDHGEKFTKVNETRGIVGRGFYYTDIRVDPTDENRVYSLSTNLWVSIDGGRTFRTTDNRIHPDHHGLWIDPLNPSTLWLANDGGVSVSYDRGATWSQFTNLPLAQFYAIHADNRQPFYHITGGLQDNGTWTGPSRTRENTGILEKHWSMVSFGDGFFAVSHPDDPDLLITESQGGSLVLTNRRTGAAQSVAPSSERGFIDQVKYRFNWNTPIVASPHGKLTVYVGSNVLFQSSDFGRTWEAISPDLTTNNKDRLKPAGGPVWYDNSTAENTGTIVSIAESPVQKGHIWVGSDDGNVQVSLDAGKKWTNVAPNLPGVEPGESWVSHVEPSRSAAATAYVALDRHFWDDYRPHIFKTTDNGKTFTRITQGLPDKAYVHVLREDPKNPNLLYAGTEMGLYFSWDGGQNWTTAKMKNLPNVAVHDILVHPRENDLILGTHGRSVLILDDATPLQQITPAIQAKDTHLFPVRHALRFSTNMGWNFDDKPFAGPNPPNGAMLFYHLKDKLDAKAEAKVEVFDASGKKVREFKDISKEKGLNRAVWNLRYDGAKLRTQPDPEQLRFSDGPSGPKVLPGVYTVKLTLGKQTLEEKIEVRLDPMLAGVEAGLKIQLDEALKLRDLQSESNEILKKLDGLATELEALERKAKADELKDAEKLIGEAKKEVEKQTLVLGNKRRANRLEDPSRPADELAGIYSTIAALEAGPTPQQLAFSADIQREVRAAMASVQAAMPKLVQNWNESLRKAGLAGLSAW